MWQGACAVAVVWFAVLVGGSAGALTITLITHEIYGPSHLSTHADDKSAEAVDEHVLPTVLPYSYTSSSVDGGASAESEYDFSSAGFDITFGQARASTFESEGWSYGTIIFSIDEDATYTAAGSYTTVDPDGRRVFLQATLRDITTDSDWLFDSLQNSNSTPNESFTLGLEEGDNGDYFDGSLTGTLIAGHEYSFYYSAAIATSPSASTSDATASGNVSLSFTPIPEPSTALLLGTSLIVLAGMRRAK